MTIETVTKTTYPPYSFKDIQPWEDTHPVVKIGDLITVEGWQLPKTGKVMDVSEDGLLWVDLPMASPGGGYHVLGSHRVTQIVRGSETWVRDNGCN